MFNYLLVCAFTIAVHWIGPTSTRRPPMGYNTFDLLATKFPGYGLQWLNETNIRAISDVLADKLQPFGYEYINIDSGWLVVES